MLFLKGVLVSMAGPTPNYAIQHILSTRSPREAALENMMMALVSLAPRFLLIAGIAVLGIVFFSPRPARPWGQRWISRRSCRRWCSKHLPVGCKGSDPAALLAAFMSTFVSTVNSGAAYMVNDIYKRYINPAGAAEALVCARLRSPRAAVILAGIAFGFVTQNVHSRHQVDRARRWCRPSSRPTC